MRIDRPRHGASIRPLNDPPPAEGNRKARLRLLIRNRLQNFRGDYSHSADPESVSFVVENGLDKHREKKAICPHELSLKVPVFLMTEEANIRMLCIRLIGGGPEASARLAGLRLYDELDGSYRK
jgi:hypothetical protein